MRAALASRSPFSPPRTSAGDRRTWPFSRMMCACSKRTGGESDAAPSMNFKDAAAAVADLARDLRLRQIDVLGFRFGAGVGLELTAARPELVRRLVLVAAPPMDGLPVIDKESLVLRIKLGVG